jgi:N-formylglutamate deformylase
MIYTLHQGTKPLLVSLPHVGTHIPDDLQAAYMPRALAVENTDWHLEHLYAFAKNLGASVLVPTHSRFVIDLNRPPENTPMYPGANNTELCPTRFFTGEPLYRDGMAPTTEEVKRRVQRYWQPYHEALQSELSRIHAQHGRAMLWDGHSIESRLPWLFDGRLPDLNLGTADGTSCSATLREQLTQVLAKQTHFSHVTDGRFKGGYITRRYGRPANGVHAVQMEKCFSTYMQTEHAPWPIDDDKVRTQLQPVLDALLRVMLEGAHLD